MPHAEVIQRFTRILDTAPTPPELLPQDWLTWCAATHSRAQAPHRRGSRLVVALAGGGALDLAVTSRLGGHSKQDG
jgi:hypothetical protein